MVTSLVIPADPSCATLHMLCKVSELLRVPLSHSLIIVLVFDSVVYLVLAQRSNVCSSKQCAKYESLVLNPVLTLLVQGKLPKVARLQRTNTHCDVHHILRIQTRRKPVDI